MTSITVYVHGVSRPEGAHRANLERRLADQLAHLGYSPTRVCTWEWRSRSPGGAGTIGGGLAFLGGALFGAGGGALTLLAGIGSAVGAASSYAQARAGIPGAARLLAWELAEARAVHDEIHVVGHSVGAEIALLALHQLAAWRIPLHGTAFLLGGTADADLDYSAAASVPQHGLVNVVNPSDGALILEVPVRGKRVIGRAGIYARGAANVRTDLGHGAQLWNLASAVAPAFEQQARPALPW
jgi:hypothetical protein